MRKIEQLQAFIVQLKAARQENLDAHVALLNGDDAALRAMGFSEGHVAELKSEDFIRSVRNINSNIRYIKKLIAELKEVQRVVVC